MLNTLCCYLTLGWRKTEIRCQMLEVHVSQCVCARSRAGNEAWQVVAQDDELRACNVGWWIEDVKEIYFH